LPASPETAVAPEKVLATTPAQPLVADTVPRGQLTSPELYLNRELTWLGFNWRVLHQAADPRTPLLERVKFLAIVSRNLDEFFMKRIGGLKQQEGAGMHELTVDGRTPTQQIRESHQMIADLKRRKDELYREVLGLLARAGIALRRVADLEAADRAALREDYVENVFPLVTPQAMDPAHPFPFVSNLSLNLLVTLHGEKDAETSLARVKVPIGKGIPRFFRVGEGLTFVPLEEVMADNLDLLFPDMVIDDCALFRVTRNAITELDEEEADDLLAMIEIELRERKFAPVVRLEVERAMTADRRGRLAAELGIDKASDVFEVGELFGMSDLDELARLDLPELDALHDPPHHPLEPGPLASPRSIFHILREEGSILVHHPYESFSASVERFLREASEDPKVRAIKVTLYRTSADTDVIKSLTNAARNGVQVAVVVELKARFDEEANIQFASRLERFGIHVTYGVVGLKTHCKVALVVRQDHDRLRRYAHIGTGNYHAGTARLYSDLGLLTADEDVGRDLTELFNYLTTGYKPRRRYRKLLPAPKALKSALLAKIEREIDLHSDEVPGHIQIKVNAVEDADLTRALYEASIAGVKVELIVRDTCRLRPGLPGVSENIRVVSVVGRFLEHSRIYYFGAGGAGEYYIGSADLMQRNLESRVEVLVPVEAEALRAKLRHLLDTQLDDRRSGWVMRADGSYALYDPGTGKRARGSQEVLIARAEKDAREATRLRRRRSAQSPRG
jgi:polyphosphate kinase